MIHLHLMKPLLLLVFALRMKWRNPHFITGLESFKYMSFSDSRFMLTDWLFDVSLLLQISLLDRCDFLEAKVYENESSLDIKFYGHTYLI